jgi:hypothetical protein
MATQLNDIAILVNNAQIAYEGDSLSWKDGFGEYTVRNAVVGGGQTEQIFSKDLTTKFGSVKFTVPNTEDNAALVREWKNNDNDNVVELVGPSSTSFSRVFTSAAIIGDPEYNAATDGTIEVEFNTAPAQ